MSRMTLPLITAGALTLTTSLLMAATPGDCAASKSASSCEAKPAANATLAAMKTMKPAAGGDIVETAVGAGSFNTLVAAVKAAGLVEALQGDGPFTVFAPTDDAFAKLPTGTIETLLKPENKAMLQGILLYHVVPADLGADKVTRLNGARSLNGQRIDFSMQGGNVMIDGATVLKADIPCTNGTIHVIDRVILPSKDTIVDVASSASQFNTLIAAAKAAGLAGALQGDGPFTVLAPTDAAFAKLPAGTVEKLLQPENRDMLASILKYHVISGRVSASEAVSAGFAKSINGTPVLFQIRNGQMFVDNAQIVATDIDASNGVIHVIDEVILPQS